MKKIKLLVIAAALMLTAAGFTACSDDNEGGIGNINLPTPQYEQVSGKYEITSAGSPYESIELSASGNYIVTLSNGGNYYNTPVNGVAKSSRRSLLDSGKAKGLTRATEYDGVIYGTFTSLGGNEFALEGFGTIKLGYSGDEARMLLDEEGFIAIDRLARRQPPCETLYSEETLPDGTALLAGHSVRQWLLPKAAGKTPMYEALLRVRDLLGEWCANDSNRDSFPPVVINITDGEASDCTDDELRRVCTQIRRLGTDDGNVLLFNIHVSTDSTSPAMVFPMPDELARANPYARLLAECSSIMPEAFDEAVRDFKGAGAVPPFYGMGYNTSIIELLSIINIGSRSITNIE